MGTTDSVYRENFTARKVTATGDTPWGATPDSVTA
jgi:hypothetical protein